MNISIGDLLTLMASEDHSQCGPDECTARPLTQSWTEQMYERYGLELLSGLTVGLKVASLRPDIAERILSRYDADRDVPDPLDFDDVILGLTEILDAWPS